MRAKKTAKTAEHQAPSKLAAKVHKLLGKTAKAAKTTKPAKKPRTIHDLIGATAKTAQMSKKGLLKKSQEKHLKCLKNDKCRAKWMKTHKERVVKWKKRCFQHPKCKLRYMAHKKSKK